MWRRLSTTLVLGLLASACGGSIAEGAAGGGGSSGAGGGASGGASGVAGAPSCAQSQDGLVVTVSPAPFECELMASKSKIWDATGIITQASENAFVLDTCSPNADCMTSLVSVSLEAAGLSLALGVGALVKLHYEVGFAWSTCSQRLVIKNLPSWGGVNNPVSAEAKLLFAGSEGVVQPPEDSGFSVEQKALGCFPGAKSVGQTPPESFALVFSGDAQSLTLGMGQTGTFELHGQTLTARNQRSFLTGNFDDYWDWSWWVTGTP